MLNVAISTPPPPRIPDHTSFAGSVGFSAGPGSATNDSATGPTTADNASQSSFHPRDAQADLPRRRLFYEIRLHLSGMMPTQDEKNHVISNATEALNKELARLDQVLPHVEEEISDEAKYGNLNHWAYSDRSQPEKKGTTAHERTRREVANASNLAVAAAVAAAGDSEVAARSESRREAMLARKRNHQVDSDYEAGPPSKRPNGTAKVKRTTETANGSASNLNAAQTAPTSAPVKRRKPVEKLAAPGMERTASTTSTTTKETHPLDPPKKRARGTTTANTTTAKKR